jgi:hypothetical protein
MLVCLGHTKKVMHDVNKPLEAPIINVHPLPIHMHENIEI